MKRSRAQRKFLNEMRGMGEVAWPARRFRVAPTFGGSLVVGQCQRSFGEVVLPRPGFRNKLLRRRDREMVVCGGDLVLVPFRRRVRCNDCVDRKRSERRRLAERELVGRRVERAWRDASWSGAARRLFQRKAG